MKRIVDIDDFMLKHPDRFACDVLAIAIEESIPYEDRPQGEWIEGENGSIKCNQCGCEIIYSYLIGNKPDFPNFCCDCGADMRGDK